MKTATLAARRWWYIMPYGDRFCIAVRSGFFMGNRWFFHSKIRLRIERGGTIRFLNARCFSQPQLLSQYCGLTNRLFIARPLQLILDIQE